MSICKLAAFDMDGTLIDGRLIEVISKKFGLYEQIRQIQSDVSIPGYIKTRKIAFILKGLEEKEVISAIQSIPLMKNCQKVISSLKKNGFKIGIITDSYSIAARILVDELGLHFFAANDLKVSHGVITGEINMPLGWDKINCPCKISVCKRFHLEMNAKRYNVNIENTMAIGDTRGDLCMINGAGIGIAFMPKDKCINRSKHTINMPDLMGILDFIR